MTTRLAAYRKSLTDERYPAALIDLDALDRNIDAVLAPVRAHNKKLRVATKSIRCPELLMHILSRAGQDAIGVMTYDAAETVFLAILGHRDLLLAYPSMHAGDLTRLANANAEGAAISVIVDARRHLEALQQAAANASTKLGVVVDVDVAYRPVGASLHLGVRRSPLRTVEDVRHIVNQIDQFPNLQFKGLMAYEAHIAGLGDADMAAPWKSRAMRAMKLAARRDVEATRRALVDAFHPSLFNGGGSGSLAWCTAEPALTEVTAGSGFIDSHLFDHFRDLRVEPAAYFALQVVRAPSADTVTCLGGGFVASGEAGVSRLPIPALPEGLSLLPMEGAGEVQTPLRLAHANQLSIGDLVFFRHAKAGELAEHVNEYLFVRGDKIVKRAKTYRGLGHCFLG